MLCVCVWVLYVSVMDLSVSRPTRFGHISLFPIEETCFYHQISNLIKEIFIIRMIQCMWYQRVFIS